ncbi:hypothetical protein [Pseudolysinimonas yzui]|uniref:Uncharacterized protein n=1 Tax=Pseudolysinimonas yzui TaxID=2708254 RepID=A0A8J3GQP0_9MICO|nr:hypothetical protein [Pseudolysinimonas yzui]GHF17342.1 hypothetical protein GCM10011600_17650 [Pseudolysinimonas yzui]
MSTFTLADAPSLDDLQVYLSRAARVEEGSVRLIAGSGVLAVYCSVFAPAGLLDESATVLGLRTLALTEAANFDAVVPVRSLLQRLERAQAEGATKVGLPMEVNTATWAAISPPRGGWQQLGEIPAAAVEQSARDGIRDVAAAVPDGVGEQIVRRVRGEVWGRPIPGAEHIPSGAAFAAFALGFLGDDAVRLYESGPWTRLSTLRGHVLVKRRAWNLLR